MLIVNLNIRGMGGNTKTRYLSNIIRSEGADFVCIQETKSKVFSDAKCFSLWGDNNIGWLHYEGVTGSGGLLSLWHKEAFCYNSHLMGKGFIDVFGTYSEANVKCVIVNVYAACNLRDKKMLWEEMSNVKASSQDIVWCFCGDFNAIRSRNERKGRTNREDQSSEIVGFNRFIDSNLLFDLPIVGKKFTWFNSNGMTKSRLDRVLITEEWLDCWPMCMQYVQRREVSDHCAIVVKSLLKDWGPKPFRSINAWLSERGFCEMVKDKWCSYSVQGSDIHMFKEKLKRLKGDLKTWNRDLFGNIVSSKKKILQEIEEFDCQDCSGDITVTGRVRRCELVCSLREIDKKLDSLMCQKAKVNWLNNGDSCSKFYHSTLRWRRHRNEVKGVEVGGQWCEEPGTVRLEARKLFENRFKSTKDYGLKIGRKTVDLSLLQFADDTLFLCEDSYANVVTLKAILRGFELASGLKINFHKSKLAIINVI